MMCRFITLMAFAATALHDEEFANPLAQSHLHGHGVSAVPPSPECWMNAMQAMHHLEDTTNNSSGMHQLGAFVCATMSHEQKKALAMELARCHHQDVGRPMFEDTCDFPIQSTQDLDSCLSKMTDVGMHSYSIFFTHVHQSCTRLTQERLTQASHVATQQLHDLLTHQTHVWAEQEALQSKMWETLSERDEAMRAQHERLLAKHEQEMLELTRATTERFKPLLGMEGLIELATNGVTWLTSFLFFLAVMNAVWILTMSKRHDRTRGFMFRLAFLEALVECALHALVYKEVLNNVQEEIGLARTWTLYAECTLYILGLLLSFVLTAPNEQDETMRYNLEMMRFMTEQREKEREAQREKERQEPERVPVIAPRMEQQPIQYEAASPVGYVPLPPSFQGAQRERPTVASSASAPTGIPMGSLDKRVLTSIALHDMLSDMGCIRQGDFPQVGSHPSPPEVRIQIVSPDTDEKKRSIDEVSTDDEDEDAEPDSKKARMESA